MSTRFFSAVKFLVSAVMALIIANTGLPLYTLVNGDGAPIPVNLSVPAVKTTVPTAGDYYVAVDGNDTNDGSFEHPFATIGAARDKIRQVKAASGLPAGGIAVCVKAGEYTVSSLVFDARDSGEPGKPVTYRAYGDGAVTLNGGTTLKSADFAPVSGSAKDRLTARARKNVVQVDLNTYSLTAADWGKLYAIGAFNIAYKYDGDVSGPNQCELFFNDARMTLARYPNGDEYLKTGDIIDMGEYGEFPPQNYIEGWADLRNPRGGTFKTDYATNKKIKTWQTLDDVWLYGFFFWDWADSSTPVKAADTKNSTLTTLYGSQYAFKKDAIYYFYNVLEELDAPGEWYLDRANGLLYLYPPAGMDEADINLSISTANIINVNNAGHILFKGFNIKGTRADAVSITGNDCVVEDCVVSNCAGSGIIINGTNNKAIGNEVMSMGKGGISLSGGDRVTLTPGNNIADNNHIHNYGEIYKTYSAGVRLNGVGNICSHNEIHEAPHMAVTYGGNDHLMEYNRIYDVVKQSSDAGAIYSGRDLTAYGNVLRYNAIYNIGSGEFQPNGIYFDDAQSGQTAYGNILVNIPQCGFQLGGGRELNVYNNLIINAGVPIHYDDRARDGVVNNGWFRGHVNDLNAGMWKGLFDSPYQTDLWKARFPKLALVTSDFADFDNPYFAVNPAFSRVNNNIIVARKNRIGNIADSVYTFSTVENNPVCLTVANPGFVDFRGGNYLLRANAPVLGKIGSFEPIPFEKIGRY